MRIISGLARGIRLAAPEGRELRPTEDRVKESMFGMLGDLRDKAVVDLFSGTGALGLEALSRGAASVLFVEQAPAHARFIQANLAAVLKSIGSGAGATELWTADVRQAHARLASRPGAFDVVFADPPYHPVGKDAYGPCELVADPAFAAWATPGVVLVLEHGSDTEPPWDPLSPWRPVRQRVFGIREVSIAVRRET